MTKRECPFDYDLLPQTKVHIGQKEGVNRDRYMKTVYDRTLSLLKAGAKGLSDKLNNSSELNLIDSPVQKCSNSKPQLQSNLRQMFLNDKLQLEATGRSIKDIPMGLCGCCRVIDNETSKCSYCDQILCSSCLAQCAKCTDAFCENCSLIVYDGDQHSMCLNCYH